MVCWKRLADDVLTWRMHARIDMLRALNRNVERTFDSSRKDAQWGKRKLKRDQK
jgi:hypothetical protein